MRTVALAVDSLPSYSVRELNEAISTLLKRGFAPRFSLNAIVSKAQLKKGHLWLTLSDGEASITAVVWSSQLQKVGFQPAETDGVRVIGKLNFWETRANLIVQVLDMRPSLSTALRKFEVVRDLLLKEGLIAEARRRSLPTYPGAIAILTSSPSSALADMLRTAKERWPLTRLFIVPIPVQGDVAKDIKAVLQSLADGQDHLEIDAIVLARGGGNREDLVVFDDEELCRELAFFPVPVVTGLGHEDDLMVAELVADYRASTPTAAINALLPSMETARGECLQRRQRLNDYVYWSISRERNRLLQRCNLWKAQSPLKFIQRHRERLLEKSLTLKALSPESVLSRGFAIVKNQAGRVIKSVEGVSARQKLIIQIDDGSIQVNVDSTQTKR